MEGQEEVDILSLHACNSAVLNERSSQTRGEEVIFESLDEVVIFALVEKISFEFSHLEMPLLKKLLVASCVGCFVGSVWRD